MKRWWSSRSEATRSSLLILAVLVCLAVGAAIRFEFCVGTIDSPFRGAWAEMRCEGVWHKQMVFCDLEHPYEPGTKVVAYRVRGAGNWNVLTQVP